MLLHDLARLRCSEHVWPDTPPFRQLRNASMTLLKVLQDRTLKLWNPHRGVLVKTYQGHGHDVRDVAVSADNSK